MGAGGTATFNDSFDYQASVVGARLALVLTAPGDFRGDLTWLGMHHTAVVRGRENLPRIGFVEAAPRTILMCLAAESGSRDAWGGMPVEPGEVVVLGAGASLHHRTASASHWAWIAVDQMRLDAHCRALLQTSLAAPLGSTVVRPSVSALSDLSHLVVEACRIAILARGVVARPEAMRALEHHILDAAVHCLATGARRDARNPGAALVAGFEAALDACGEDAPMQVVLALLGSTERGLRAACAQCLGMGPNEYRRLRRLNRVRAALRHADVVSSVPDIVASFGISGLGRFAGQYRRAFGESPSSTLRSARSRCP